MIGKKVAVLGLGVAGEACARASFEAGADVTVFDAADGEAQRARAATLKGAVISLGDEAPDLSGFDLAVLSPGIAPGTATWKAAGAAREMIGEIELAYRLGVRPAVAVTGTNGKTTVTEMIAACLRAAGRDGVAAGNIGAPLVDAVGDSIVAEVSSFQCATLDTFTVPVAVLTNIAEDHLDWHGTVDAYTSAKLRLLEAAQDEIVVHSSCAGFADGSAARVTIYDSGAPGAQGAGVSDGWISVRGTTVIEVGELRSNLKPFVEDAVAASAAASLSGVSTAAIADGLRGYAPGRHRLEDVGLVRGVRFIDDSKATDPHAAIAAIGAFPGAVLIAGGYNKGLDMGSLRAHAHELRAVVAIGAAAQEIVDAFDGAGIPVERAGEMLEAVERAHALAGEHGVVLLSPACASFDRYTSYAARGEDFIAAVARLKEKL